MNRSEARHLLRRAGMATRPGEISAYLPYSRSAAVDEMLNIGLNGGAGLPSAAGDKQWEYMVKVSNWWVNRWATAERSIEMKLLLFFHSHLAVNYEKIKTGQQVRNYVSTLHDDVLGHWPTMLERISLSPAMLLYLDNWTNRVGQPNENFARELFELHLLGHGNYSQRDIEESARAWTGWTVSDGGAGSMVFSGGDHDDRNKTIFGVTKNWTGPGVIQHVFADPTLSRIAARHLAGKMWTYFAGTTASASTLDSVSESFRTSGFQIRALVAAILNHNDFWSGAALEPHPRSPVEFVSDYLRVIGLTANGFDVHWSLRDMGQALIDAPNPSGWSRNSFISTGTWLARAEFARWVMWKVPDNYLNHIEDLPVTQAVEAGLQTFGLAENAANITRVALQEGIAEERGKRGWAEQENLMTAMAMSPDMHIC